MKIFNLLLLVGNHHFLEPEPRQSTDKIAGSFSTASISFSFITPQVTANAIIITVNENHATTAKTIGKPAFEIAEWLVAPLIKLVQNNRLDSFVRENFLKKILLGNSRDPIQLRLPCTPI